MANTLALVPIEPPSQNLNRTWQVEFARFFPRPLRSPPSSSASSLLAYPKCKAPGKGTWITASTPAALQVLKNGSHERSVLMVLVTGKIHEEHFVSNLYFSWPQISCDSQCTGRGSRAVFFSYGDCCGQVHKFALRFPSAHEVEMFFHFAKENLSSATEIGVSGNDFIQENSSHSEFTASDILQSRAEEVSSLADNDETYKPDLCGLINIDQLGGSSGKQDMVNDLDNSFSTFPPSFTSLLTNCSAETSRDATGEPKAQEWIDPNSQITSCKLDPDFHDILVKVVKALGDSSAMKTDAAGKPKAHNITGDNAQIATCILDPSFIDILAKVEEIWNELSF